MQRALLPDKGRPWPWHMRHVGGWRVGQTWSLGLSSCAEQRGLRRGLVRPGVALRDASLCVYSESCGALQVPGGSALPGIWSLKWLQWGSVRDLLLCVFYTRKKSSSLGLQLLLSPTCKSIKALETSQYFDTQLKPHKHTPDLPHCSGAETAKAFKTL